VSLRIRTRSICPPPSASTRGDIHPAHASSIPRCRRPRRSSASPIVPDSPCPRVMRLLMCWSFFRRVSATAAKPRRRLRSPARLRPQARECNRGPPWTLHSTLPLHWRLPHVWTPEILITAAPTPRTGRAPVQLALLPLGSLLYSGRVLHLPLRFQQDLAKVQYGRQETIMEARSCSGAPLLYMGLLNALSE
jgi:hypothetical protein